jgi:hypothetical protein
LAGGRGRRSLSTGLVLLQLGQGFTWNVASPRRFGHSRPDAIGAYSSGNPEVQERPTPLLAQASCPGVTAGGRRANISHGTSPPEATMRFSLPRVRRDGFARPRGVGSVSVPRGTLHSGRQKAERCWFGSCFTRNMAPRGREGFSPRRVRGQGFGRRGRGERFT